MQLWNKYNKEELEKQLRAKGHTYVTVSFYTYAKIQDPHSFRNELYAMWDSLDVIGRTYVAHEGINSQIAVPKVNFDVFKELLPGQVLEVLNVAEIASKLRAIELSMVLQLRERLPDNFVSSVLRLAFMWEFTEVDHVFENFVYFFHEVAARLTVGAANVILRSSLVHL